MTTELLTESRTSHRRIKSDGVFTRVFRWRRLFIALTSVLVFVFLLLQYSMLSANMGVVSNALGASHAQQAPTEPPPDTKPHLAADASAELLRRPRSQSSPQQQSVTPPPSPPLAELPVSDSIAIVVQAERQEAVKNAMRFAWSNYENTSFGADEVDPISGEPKPKVWGGIAASMVDGMDTLWIMGLHDEFARARDYVVHNLSFDHLGAGGEKISVFETIIREVGGLLSAFELSGDDGFKHKAQELMDLLMPAFNSSEGVFYTYLNPQTKAKGFASWFQYYASLADVGTLQLEARCLSEITGDPKYAVAGDAFYQILQREGSFNHTGLFSIKFDTSTGHFVNEYSTVSIGAMGDSFYEYLLKVYLFSGKRSEDAYLRQLYDDAVAGMETYLLTYSAPDDAYYLAEAKLPSLTKKTRMEHLACFIPGLLALGTLHEHSDADKNARHMKLAEQLMGTCYEMYHREKTGLSPDAVSFPGFEPQDTAYRLRPEVVESLFYMYRITHDSKYREWGWAIFESLEAHAKAPHGYGTVRNVSEVPAEIENKMESFFLAETLKYHYLLQAPVDVISLDEYVFNTEAHPLRIRKR